MSLFKGRDEGLTHGAIETASSPGNKSAALEYKNKSRIFLTAGFIQLELLLVIWQQ